MQQRKRFFSILLKTANVSIELPISQELVVYCIWWNFSLVEIPFIEYKSTNYAVLPRTLVIINTAVSIASFMEIFKGGLPGPK